MNNIRKMAVVATVLALAACNSGDPDAQGDGAAAGPASATPAANAEDASGPS